MSTIVYTVQPRLLQVIISIIIFCAVEEQHYLFCEHNLYSTLTTIIILWRWFAHRVVQLVIFSDIGKVSFINFGDSCRMLKLCHGTNNIITINLLVYNCIVQSSFSVRFIIMFFNVYGYLTYFVILITQWDLISNGHHWGETESMTVI